MRLLGLLCGGGFAMGCGAVAMAAPPAPAVSIAAPVHVTPGHIVDGAPAADWVGIAAEDLLVMDLAPDAKARVPNPVPRRVVIQLMPPPFSQGWVGNIRRLAAAHWWDGTAVYRVQDNYVAQWGDGEDDKAKAKPLPVGLVTVGEADYERELGGAFHGSISEVRIAKDAYAATTAFIAGFPIAIAEPKGGPTMKVIVKAWPIHCYAMVGVARDLSPDTGTGAELYTVIGHAPRQLDRNIALVGRVIVGMQYLSSLPRGPGPLGVYTDPADRVPIVSVRLASEMPADTRPRFQYLSTESGSFAAYANARANRQDAFFRVPAGGADICNVPVPVRAVP